MPVARAKRSIETWGWSPVVRRVEAALGIKLKDVQGRGRTPARVEAKAVLIYVGRERSGLTLTELARRLEINPSHVTRGYERARQQMQTDQEFRTLVKGILGG